MNGKRRLIIRLWFVRFNDITCGCCYCCCCYCSVRSSHRQNGFRNHKYSPMKCWNEAGIEEPSSYYDKQCALRLFSSQNILSVLLKFFHSFLTVGVVFRPFILMLPWKHMDTHTHTHQSKYKNWLSIAPVQHSLNVFVFWMWCGDDDVQNGNMLIHQSMCVCTHFISFSLLLSSSFSHCRHL